MDVKISNEMDILYNPKANLCILKLYENKQKALEYELDLNDVEHLGKVLADIVLKLRGES